MWGGGPLVSASLPAQAAGAQVTSGYTPGDTFSCCCSSVSFSPSTFLCIAASWVVVDKNIHTIGAKQSQFLGSKRKEMVYRYCGTFSYRERLLEQNRDIGKRDGVKTTCLLVHLVQGHIAPPPLFLSPPPSSHPPNAISRAAGLRFVSSPSHPPPPPNRIMDRFW